MVEASVARRLSAVRFRWSARFGFFLRAEAPVVGLGYPVPPRTAVLGLIAAVLGLPRDALAIELADAQVALRGRCPRTHWHAWNQRKIRTMRFLPTSFSQDAPVEILATQETPSQSRQEWLCDPDFEVIASLPERWHGDFAARVREGLSHFTPCMGLSEMIASVAHVSDEMLTPLPEGTYRIASVMRRGEGDRVAFEDIMREELRVLSLSMPREVTAERRFTHETYFVAPSGTAIPVHTAAAWQSSVGAVMFL